jgi:aminoglycoside phosphotransferase (APT) family kinase protein
MEDSEPGRIEAALVILGYRAVTDVRPVGGGWESEIWRADTSSGPRAVRVFVGPDRTHDAWQEGSVIATLGEVGYPVPRIHNVVTDPDLLDRPFLVMDLVDGGSLWDPEVTDRSLAAGATAELMAQLHLIDPSHFDLPHWNLERWRDEARPYVERFPGLGPPLDWVIDRIRLLAPVPCHNDLHPGNILQDSGGRMWVVDWTAFGIGDPRLDGAWTRMLGTMFGGASFVGLFTETYERATGLTLADPAVDALTALRRVADVLWFLTPEGARVIRAGAEIDKQIGHLTVATRWIEEATGMRIPEVDVLVGRL